MFGHVGDQKFNSCKSAGDQEVMGEVAKTLSITISGGNSSALIIRSRCLAVESCLGWGPSLCQILGNGRKRLENLPSMARVPWSEPHSAAGAMVRSGRCSVLGAERKWRCCAPEQGQGATGKGCYFIPGARVGLH